VFALHTVIKTFSEQLDKPASKLLGKPLAEYIAGHVTMQGGGHPEPRQVQRVVARCSQADWYPGKRTEARKGAGRPPTFSEHQKNEVARVAMELKRKRLAPTPRRVRARLPNLTINKETQQFMSSRTVQRIYATRCYDETPDDPWQFLACASQDVLANFLKPLRVACARWILRHLTARSWYSYVSIDPCYTLLPKSQERLEEQQIKAMGKVRWMSERSRKTDNNNLRHPSTVGSQAGGDVTKVDWTPVFARGRVAIYVVDVDKAKLDTRLPTKLTDAENMAKFVKYVLPLTLQKMKAKNAWADLPRTVVHDKANCMVTNQHHRLNGRFAEGLREGGFRSWVGGDDGTAETKWLVKKWGDVYMHETLISHIRRLLDNDFASTRLYETREQFVERLHKVEEHLNSPGFAAVGGGGLLALAKSLPKRCEDVIKRGVGRIPKLIACASCK
jgi:hypothetical protein